MGCPPGPLACADSISAPSGSTTSNVPLSFGQRARRLRLVANGVECDALQLLAVTLIAVNLDRLTEAVNLLGRVVHRQFAAVVEPGMSGPPEGK